MTIVGGWGATFNIDLCACLQRGNICAFIENFAIGERSSSGWRFKRFLSPSARALDTRSFLPRKWSQDFPH